MEDSAGFFILPFMSMFSGIWCFFAVFQLIMVLVMLVAMVFWILMLIDVLKRDEADFPSKAENQKLMWGLIVGLTGWVGALIYYFVVYKVKGKAE